MEAPEGQNRPTAGALGVPRSIGLALAIVIGSGIFVLPAWIAGLHPEPLAYVGIWLLGGLLALCIALCYAELATVLPESGGYIVYLRRIWGKPLAVVYGWAAIFILYPSSIAALARVFGRSLHDLCGGWASPTIFAALLLLLAASINMLGLKRSLDLQSPLVLAKIGIVLLLGIVGVTMASADGWSAEVAVGEAFGLEALFLGLVGVMWCYEGFLEVVVVAGEIRAPRENLVRVLVGSVLCVSVLYLFFNLALLHQMGTAAMVGREAVAADLAAGLFGSKGRVLVDLAVAVATASATMGLLASGPHILASMAREAEFPALAARLGPDGRTPWLAVGVLAAASLVYALVGSFEGLVKYFSFSTGLFSILILLAGWRLRWRNQVPREWMRIPLWPLPLLLALVGTAGMVGWSFRSQPRASLAGLAIMALVLLPLAWRRRKQAV